MKTKLGNFITAFYEHGFLYTFICLISGLVLTIWPDSTLLIFAVMGGVLILYGIIKTIAYFAKARTRPSDQHGFAKGMITIALGIIILLNTVVLLSLLPLAVGFFLIAVGIVRFETGLELRKAYCTKWFTDAMVAVVYVALGSMCLYQAFNPALLLRILGIVLLVECIVDLISKLVLSKMVKNITTP